MAKKNKLKTEDVLGVATADISNMCEAALVSHAKGDKSTWAAKRLP